MAANFELLVAPSGSGKTNYLLSEYRAVHRQAAKNQQLGNTLWLTPTRRSRDFLLDELLDETLPVCFAPHIFTFEQFAEEVLLGTSEKSLLIHNVTQRKLIRNIIQNSHQSKKLSYFAPVVETTGFLDLVLQFILELKREEVWPQHFEEACTQRNAKQTLSKTREQKGIELALLYKEYQAGLLKHQWYDREGRFWLARDLMETTDARGPLNPSLELVIVDGFTDFTQTQQEMLQILAGWANRFVVSLQGEENRNTKHASTREELFAKTTTAVHQFKKKKATFLKLSVVAPQKSEDLNHISSNLFRNPRDVTQHHHAENIEIIAAMGIIGEIEILASRIKHQLLQGVLPQSIVVAHRDISSSAALFREVFTESGIPCHVAEGLPLSHQPLLKALFSVIDAELNDWDFDALMKLFHNNYLRPRWNKERHEETISAVAAELRREKLHTSRKTILRNFERRVEALEKRLEDVSSENSEPLSRYEQRLLSANGFLQHYADATSQLLKKHRFADWVNLLRTVSIHLGITPKKRLAEENAELDFLQKQDARAWEVFDGLLSEAATADDIIESSEPKLSLSQFATELRDLLQTELLSPAGSPQGCVLVLNAGEVRNLDVPHLYLAGLTEKSFPRSGGEDCIYNEAERKQLGESGLNIRQHKIGSQDEMLLFYGIVTRATESLHFSYPAVSANGQPLFPSPYLTAVKDLFLEDALPIKQEGQLNPVPHFENMLTTADLRLVATENLHHRDAALFRTMGEEPVTASVTQNILAAAEMDAARFATKGFTNYEGLLQNEQNQNVLQNHFEKEYQFSTTQFESYVRCPFQFMLSDVLHIEPLESPEVATDHRERGIIVHDILATLHQAIIEELQESSNPSPSPQEMSERFIRLVEEKFESRFSNSTLLKTLGLIEAQLLEEWGVAFEEQWEAYRLTMQEEWEEPPRVKLWEVPFGDVPHQEGDNAVAEHSHLTLGDKENYVHVRGRIDRIDVGEKEDRQFFTVIDYKTGSPKSFKPEDVRNGKAIQLALYLVAVCQLNITGNEAEPYQMGYWSLKEKGFMTGFSQGRKKEIHSLDKETIQTIEESLTELLPQLAFDMRRGYFPVDNDNKTCASYCPYSTICRVNQVRSVAETLEKQR
ncbi:ATP-dependent nuclease, subunit B [hydrothermal vent metagenome]|uniref:ATP-dependent nuclease, subunit B n=1 Tax=hydrothermal vent metagenome TaxID=652676 RepID=A0A3B1D780_9ZZZZ